MDIYEAMSGRMGLSNEEMTRRLSQVLFEDHPRYMYKVTGMGLFVIDYPTGRQMGTFSVDECIRLVTQFCTQIGYKGHEPMDQTLRAQALFNRRYCAQVRLGSWLGKHLQRRRTEYLLH